MAVLWRSDTALYKKADKHQKGRVVMTHTGPFLSYFVDWSLSQIDTHLYLNNSFSYATYLV